MRRFGSAAAAAAAAAITLAAAGSAAVSTSNQAAPPSGAALEALAKPVSYSPFAAQRVYFVMPDRYANGDPANDRGGLTGSRLVTGYDPTSTGWFHGGDLRGLTGTCTDTRSGLARLVDLGFTGVWVTPAVVQQAVQGDSAAYHGYWGRDFTNVEPRLGANDDFAAFANCAHRLGLQVYLDVVVNHTADVILLAGGTTFRGPDEMPFRDCQLLGRLGIRRLGSRGKRLQGKFTGEGWHWSTMDYYLDRDPALYDRVMKYSRLERWRLPWRLKQVWSHHRWVLGKKVLE